MSRVCGARGQGGIGRFCCGRDRPEEEASKPAAVCRHRRRAPPQPRRGGPHARRGAGFGGMRWTSCSRRVRQARVGHLRAACTMRLRWRRVRQSVPDRCAACTWSAPRRKRPVSIASGVSVSTCIGGRCVGGAHRQGNLCRSVRGLRVERTFEGAARFGCVLGERVEGHPRAVHCRCARGGEPGSGRCPACASNATPPAGTTTPCRWLAR